MTESKLENTVLYIVVFTLLGVLLALNLVMLSNYINFKVDRDLWSPIATISGSIIGGVIGALVAVYASKKQVTNQKENFDKDLDFRIEAQKIDFNNQLKLQQETEQLWMKKQHKGQLIYLVELELEAIKIRNNSKVLYDNFFEYVQDSQGVHNYRLASRVNKADGFVWNHLNGLIDYELQFRLRQLQSQYNEMAEILFMNIWKIQDEIDYKTIELNELKQRKTRTPKEEVDVKRISVELETIKGEFSYYYDEKKYFWTQASKAVYFEQAEDARKLIRESIIKSCEMNDIKIPVDPNEY